MFKALWDAMTKAPPPGWVYPVYGVALAALVVVVKGKSGDRWALFAMLGGLGVISGLIFASLGVGKKGGGS